ncbi:MAG: bifunctional phosphoribosylaminoimidazolecarboxamide formyltransferase/IMP cyclohydrolase [Fidelibacterota bacterium]
MTIEKTTVKRALISVSNKENIPEFGKGLSDLGVEIISTGGTARVLKDSGIPVRDISDFTGFPEMMDGRVKTLHPRVHGGILGHRDKHASDARTHDMEWIDLLVCNFYPFPEVVRKDRTPLDVALEEIDIGGPTMVRSAAKNMGWVGVVVDPNDYPVVLEELTAQGGLTFETRRRLSAKAFGQVAQYDTFIHTYLEQEAFPDTLSMTFRKSYDLRYGENPHQHAAAYRTPYHPAPSILNARIHQGKQLSYNNIADADGALACVRDFSRPACVVVKHANPCGVATGDDITDCFRRAFSADSLSAFGGIVALNRPCPKDIAEELRKIFVEIVLAPGYDSEALGIFSKKKKLRILEVGDVSERGEALEFKYVDGGMLIQERNVKAISGDDLQVVTKTRPTENHIRDMLFGWTVLKHVKSNAILTARDSTTVGIGPGQVSRVDAVDIAVRKSVTGTTGAILASDAFFPFRDSIDRLAGTGIEAVIQPGGSIRDQEVIDACDEHGIAMVFTGVRCFRH